MLQNLKTNAHLIAKEKWYKWRCQLTTGVKQQIEAMNVNLKEVCYQLNFIPAIKLISEILLNRTNDASTLRGNRLPTLCLFYETVAWNCRRNSRVKRPRLKLLLSATR